MKPMVARRLIAAAVVLLGSLWAAALVISGALMASGTAFSAFRDYTTLLGLTFIGAGQFVFLVIVADRMFPRADRRLVAVVESITGVAPPLGILILTLKILAGDAP